MCECVCIYVDYTLRPLYSSRSASVILKFAEEFSISMLDWSFT
jgi:hypothetical protein